MQLFVQFVFGSAPCAANSLSEEKLNVIGTIIFIVSPVCALSSN